jgi:hypothetical protein
MQLHRIAVPRETLLGMPENERNFFIAIGHLLNELNLLNKLFYRCSQYPTADRLVGKAQATQAICVAKIVAGKLAAGWELPRNFYFNTRLSREYDPLLSPEASEARRELGRYFGCNTNVISAIRNRYAFHYDPERFSAALAASSEEDGWEMFLTEETGNSLYFFSEVIIGHGLLEHINQRSHQAAMDTLIDDIASIGHLFITFLTGCLVVISERYFQDGGGLPIKSVEIEDPPGLDDVPIPFFVLVPSEAGKLINPADPASDQ